MLWIFTKKIIWGRGEYGVSWTSGPTFSSSQKYEKVSIMGRGEYGEEILSSSSQKYEKAYDRVSWTFIEEMLTLRCYAVKWRGWMKKVI
jgi:hypothetical protein